MSTPSATTTCEQLQQSLIETTLEAYRFQRTFRQVLMKLEPTQTEKFMSRVDYFLARIERNFQDAGMSISILHEGDRYEAGMPVSPLNLDEFDTDDDQLVIHQMIEPVILSGQAIQRVGTVLLRKDS